ncbi:MAG: hypothetical protein JW751_17090 [Polyangiaceae bacterium]|nr:hypothetical protein [Polyangiaceae bacterium]
MVRPQRPTFPSSSEPSVRRLGVGRPSSPGSDRPLRAQLVVAVVVLLVLIAVPLYLMRRPAVTPIATSASAPSSAEALVSALARQAEQARYKEDRVKLGPLQKVKCAPSPASKGQEGPLCDDLPFFEQALSKAIQENADCAPRESKAGSINYVMQIDFHDKRVVVFPGASGDWRGPAAQKAAKCVKRTLPAVDWTAIQHQYRFYTIAILATYPAPSTPAGAGSADLFD